MSNILTDPKTIELTLAERVALKVEIDELREQINKLKENPDYPLSVFVELLDLEKSIMEILKKVYSKYELNNISYRK